MTDNRRFTRWNIDLPTTVTLEGAQACTDCKVSNISFKGAQICVAMKLAKDTFIKLCLTLAEGFSLTVEAWIVWHKTIDGHNVYGLYFTHISDADKEKIYRFLRRDFPQQVNQSWWQGIEKGGENMKQETLQDKRVFARFAKSFPVRFLEANTYTEIEAEATDISAKGIGVVSGKELIPPVPLELWLDIPDKGEPFYIRGNVVWSKPTGSDRYRSGISFEKADLLGLARVLRAK
ncbi:MAG: PilZ domain-containing protein [Candidatus Omnitrophica bacterium]|nr:PilZ domain-containing protein [Candidatus Omnitrophota bacterium]MDD5237515.1 PilZ domain-containing protein [Candidatus Omnitrophota bacterium]